MVIGWHDSIYFVIGSPLQLIKKKGKKDILLSLALCSTYIKTKRLISMDVDTMKVSSVFQETQNPQRLGFQKKYCPWQISLPQTVLLSMPI